MKVFINGKQEQLEQSELTIMEFIVNKGLQPDHVVVEYNGSVLDSEQWQQTIMKENDQLEVLRFVGGG